MRKSFFNVTADEEGSYFLANPFQVLLVASLTVACHAIKKSFAAPVASLPASFSLIM
jgi:hypothetical protein